MDIVNLICRQSLSALFQKLNNDKPLFEVVFHICVIVLCDALSHADLHVVCYSDALLALRCCCFQEVVYADDLSTYRQFASSVNEDFILSQLRRCQHELHE